MRGFGTLALMILATSAVPAKLAAQWDSYPTANVPRTADKKPILDGPTPKTADGKPDLSGVWEYRGLGAGRGGPGAAGAPPAAAPPPPPTAQGASQGLGPRPRGPNQFFNIGSTVPGGLPFTPWAAELRKQRASENNKDNPDAHCLPLGLMQLHTHPQPRKIIQNPNVIVILYEAQGGIRQIFTDGRPLPKPDVQPWWYGYSVGHWEGDTLVVETTGFRDDVWLDVEGSPLTNTGKMTERFRRPNYGTLEMAITVEDPKAYTKPWTVNISQRIYPDQELIEFICNENDRSGAHLVGK